MLNKVTRLLLDLQYWYIKVQMHTKTTVLQT